MAQSSPIRLDNNLVREADSVGKLYKRSTPRQIEYWAELGKVVEGSLNADDLIAIRQGLSLINVLPKDSQAVAAADVFADIEGDRKAGDLSQKVSVAAINYQASKAHPGMLDQIHSDGTIETGLFKDGKFVSQ